MTTGACMRLCSTDKTAAKRLCCLVCEGRSNNACSPSHEPVPAAVCNERRAGLKAKPPFLQLTKHRLDHGISLLVHSYQVLQAELLGGIAQPPDVLLRQGTQNG